MWNDKEYVTARFGSEAEAAWWLGLSVEGYREWPSKLWPVQKRFAQLAFATREAGAQRMHLGKLPTDLDDDGDAVFEDVIDKIPLAISLSILFPQPTPVRLLGLRPGRKRRAPDNHHAAFPPADAVTG